VVTDVVAVDEDKDALLRLAASAQTGSEHPLAAAVLAAARQHGIAYDRPESFAAVTGQGLTARVGDSDIAVGNRLMMAGVASDTAALDDTAAALENQGKTVMWLAQTVAGAAGRVLGLIAVSDQVRPQSAAALARLRRRGLKTVMLTGDNGRTAAAIAEAVGIDRVRAEVLPGEKAQEVEALRGPGHVVAMVGDGVNDAPALAAADIGMAMGTGSDVAMETAGITLMRGDPALIPAAFDISRATYNKIRQNLFWAFIYNVIGIPLAAIGLLNPVIAGAAMAFSSVSVVSNSLLLRRWRPNVQE
jgi:Cu+-exporting ATPase